MFALQGQGDVRLMLSTGSLPPLLEQLAQDEATVAVLRAVGFTSAGPTACIGRLAGK